MARMWHGCNAGDLMASCLGGTPIAGEAEGDKDAQGTACRPPSGAQETIGRFSQGFGWFGLGALAAGATAWAIFSQTEDRRLTAKSPTAKSPAAKSPTWCWTSPSWRSTG